MTLSTNLYVLDEVDVPALFRFGQSLLAKYDDRPEPQRQQPDQQRSEDRESYRGEGARMLSNHIGQGLPAILDIHYRRDAPLASAEQAATCTSYCDPAEDEHDHPRACWADVDFDTAYSYKDSAGRRCGDLHALLVSEMGQWLDARGVRWEWRNEYTGEVHGGDDRYVRLVDLVAGSDEAVAWFQASVLPAIAAHIAGPAGN